MKRGWIPSIGGWLLGSSLALGQSVVPGSPSAVTYAVAPPPGVQLPNQVPAGVGQPAVPGHGAPVMARQVPVAGPVAPPPVGAVPQAVPVGQGAVVGGGPVVPGPTCAPTYPTIPEGVCPAAGPLDCGPSGLDTCFYANGEFLLWRLNGRNLPDLYPILGLTNLNTAGVIEDFCLEGHRPGFRGFTGIWLDDAHTLGFEVGGFFLEREESRFASQTVVYPLDNLGAIPPQLLITSGDPTYGVVDPPEVLRSGDQLTSIIVGEAYSRLWGAEANWRGTSCVWGNITFDGLVGFRHVSLEEGLDLRGDFIFDNFPAQDVVGDIPRTAVMHTFDQIKTENRFYGAQIGGGFELEERRVILNGGFKFAVGGTWQKFQTVGVTVQDPALLQLTSGGPIIARPQTVITGGLVTPSVPGGVVTCDQVRVSVIPELSTNLGYQLTDGLRAYVGYNFMVITNLIRPGDLSYQNTDSRTSSLVVHGVNFGMQLRY